jgi:hypothetical protein
MRRRSCVRYFRFRKQVFVFVRKSDLTVQTSLAERIRFTADNRMGAKVREISDCLPTHVYSAGKVMMCRICPCRVASCSESTATPTDVATMLLLRCYSCPLHNDFTVGHVWKSAAAFPLPYVST